MEWTRQYRKSQDAAPEIPSTPDAAISYLLAGNARFVGETVPDVVAPSTAVGSQVPMDIPIPTPKQTPFCVVLGCSDARVPMELLFGVKPNQVFVVRVAGNVLADECLGSIEYALHNFHESVHLLVVLGHTGCGAIGAAVDAYLDPTKHNSIAFTRSLRAVVNHVLIAVRAGAVSLEEYWGPQVVNDPGYRSALIEVGVYLNAGMTAFHLQEEMRPDVNFGVRAVYAVFDVATCRVIGPDLDPETDDTSRLAPAPTHPDELIALGRQIACSPMVGRHLSKGLRDSKVSR